jgi:hypothetical protein
MGVSQPVDVVLAALDELVTVLRETTERNRMAIRRAKRSADSVIVVIGTPTSSRWNCVH